VARAVSDLANRDAVFVIDTGINTVWSANWIRQSGSQRIIGSFNNVAVGTALGQANGIQALDRSRQVIALCGDGGFNMLMCEFLTAVHHKLPVKVVVYNNSCFGLIPLEAEGVGLPAFREGIEFPNPDFAALARACGGHGFGARQPGQLHRPSQSMGPRSSIVSWRPTRCLIFRILTWTRSATMPSPRSRKR
jgi:pyruvate dehydrogenase (quinone)